jgi:hypothetical protein
MNHEVCLESAAARAKQMEKYPEQFEDMCSFFTSFYPNIHKEDNN